MVLVPKLKTKAQDSVATSRTKKRRKREVKENFYDRQTKQNFLLGTYKKLVELCVFSTGNVPKRNRKGCGRFGTKVVVKIRKAKLLPTDFPNPWCLGGISRKIQANFLPEKTPFCFC